MPQDSTIDVPVHSLSAGEVLAGLGASERGLDESEAKVRREKHGPNELPRAEPSSRLRRFLGQFLDPVVGILIAAALISGAVGDLVDTLAILAIVLLNGVVGFLQEERAENAIAALENYSPPLAKVHRDGNLRSIPAAELVPGDVVVVEGGDHVPADARLLRGFDLRVGEAALTGESAPVTKEAGGGLAPETPLGDRINMIYMGTSVAAGRAEAVVAATGAATELGRIAGLLGRASREPTPLQRRLGELGRVLIVVVLGIAALVFGLNALRGGPLLPSFLLSVGLAVAAVPEGLPAVVTLVLAIGLQRLARREALVRRLPSVETLGSVTVVCSDKTGTLTRNEMTAREIVVAGFRYRVEGAGYEPRGDFRPIVGEGENDLGEAADPAASSDLTRVLRIAAWCNSARVEPDPEKPGAWRVVGDPTEGALIVAALKAGIDAKEKDGRVLHEIPFDSERKAMSIVLEGPDGSATMYTKGAPEVVLGKCVGERRDGKVEPLTPERREELRRTSADMAARALRVLAVADRDLPDRDEETLDEEEGLVFAGMIGMIDPPREEAKEAVKKCRSAGIRPVMITGDHPDTAVAIARELGIAGRDDRVLTGTDLDRMDAAELTRAVRETAVYARVTAEHKLRVVEAWKAGGDVVAMTGDGVNDAPALKAADIGIAMGRTGSDVTKESADMVLTDDNFTTIVGAVEEGRGIYANIHKFIHFLLASNASEVLLMLLAAILGWPAPLTAVQLLWINLVTDGLPALALGFEPLERGIMNRPPRPPREPVITAERGRRILLHGALIAAAGAFAFEYTSLRYDDVERARTATFCTMAFAQLFFALACRSGIDTFWNLGPFTNPLLFGAIAASALLQAAAVTIPFARRLFDVPDHPGADWLHILPLALLPVTIVECAKLVRRRSGRASAPDAEPTYEAVAASAAG